MQGGLAFRVIALVWFVIRKPIARRQAVIIRVMLRRPDPFSGEQVRGLEMAGIFFCCVLGLGGLTLVLLY
ncbi:hypothetical protein ACX5I6_13975 [Arthrobacter sp. MMS24-T111]